MRIDTEEQWAAAVAECRRLDALNGRAVVPGEEIERIDGGGLADVVTKAPDALVYVPERYYPMPREYFDDEACEEFSAATLDTYYERSTPSTVEEHRLIVAEQRRLLAERRKTWSQGR